MFKSVPPTIFSILYRITYLFFAMSFELKYVSVYIGNVGENPLLCK